MGTTLTDAWNGAMGGMAERLAAHLPQLLGPLALLLAGWPGCCAWPHAEALRCSTP